jgi:hypothetical protein
MNIKELKGTVSLEDFVEGITHKKTPGEIWEDEVDCNQCPYKEKCEAICDQVEKELDVSAYCNQVIDFLLGDIEFEDFVKET